MRRKYLNFVALLAVVTGPISCGGSGGGGAPTSAPSAQRSGYVLSSFRYVFPEHESDPCPGGFTLGAVERRLLGQEPIPDDCLDPEANADPEFKELLGPGTVDGVDLDSFSSFGEQCGENGFSDPEGNSGVDYQLWRSIGCVQGFQEGEISDIVVGGAVANGSMTILLELIGFEGDDDQDLQVQMFASQQSPPLGADGSILPFGTLSVHEDERYHSTVGSAQMRDGVIVAGPMDVRIRLNIQIVEGDISFRDAVVRVEPMPDGTIRGAIFGYQEIAEVYDTFGIQVGQAGAQALSYTCTGLWDSLKKNADGGFDPATGACNSISVAYQFEAIPAFVAR